MRHDCTTGHDAGFHIAVGKDHVFGYFAQVWNNLDHTEDCGCPQCEYDQPILEGDNLAGWRGVLDYVKEATGIDISAEILGV